jgi:phosphatidylglycerophosphatase A
VKTLSKIFATSFGIGFFPIAPGTATSLVFVLAYKFYLYSLHWAVFMGLLILLYFFGAMASTSYSASLKEKDPRRITIDEAAGQLLPMFLLPPTWTNMAIAFLLFRIFDILKPFPIRRTEAFPRGWGIMTDDIVAGLYTGILINFYLLLR